MSRIILLYINLFLSLYACSQPENNTGKIVCGADRIPDYLPLIIGKRIGIVANQTSRIENKHLIDTLLSRKINIVRVFSPEHGFRGNREDGTIIGNETDKVTGIPIFSLYGSTNEMPLDQLKDIDIVIFDLQDVGVRFYTYISTLHYVMKACAQTGIKLIILDRPNPNGNYVDGPVLRPEFSSFVGIHPIPVVHGMTIGELAKMINGEGWLGNNLVCDIEVILCKNYQHSSQYCPPVPPSPNLPNLQAIKLYPSLAFFEGTQISIGRGTDFPFQVFGHPKLGFGDFWFTPESRPGFSVHPPREGEKCRGLDLRNYSPENGIWESINLEWLIIAYQSFPDKDKFFTSYFDKLAGTDQLRKDIQSGLSEKEIRGKWEKGLKEFSIIREKYVSYP